MANNGPFKEQTVLDHSNTKLVCYSDPHCTTIIQIPALNHTPVFQLFNFSFFFRMGPPELPTYQDCHELWSKKRRRQLREQLQVEGGLATATQGVSQGGGSPHQTSGPVSKSGSVISQPSSEKLEENSSQG